MIGPLADMGYQSSVTRSFSRLIARRTYPSRNRKRHSRNRKRQSQNRKRQSQKRKRQRSGRIAAGRDIRTVQAFCFPASGLGGVHWSVRQCLQRRLLFRREL